MYEEKLCFYVQEAAIEEYFKPIDKEAEIIVKMQLEGEEKSMREMMAAMQRQALVEKTEAEKLAHTQQSNKKEDSQDTASTASQKHAQMRWLQVEIELFCKSSHIPLIYFWMYLLRSDSFVAPVVSPRCQRHQKDSNKGGNILSDFVYHVWQFPRWADIAVRMILFDAEFKIIFHRNDQIIVASDMSNWLTDDNLEFSNWETFLCHFLLNMVKQKP